MRTNSMKAIIFDMDGVLVDSEPHHILIEKKLFSKLNLNVDSNEHSCYMGKATDLMWNEIINKRKLVQKVDDLVTLTNDEGKAYFSNLKKIEAMPGIINILGKIFQRGIPMAVASSSAPEIIDIILKRADLYKFFLQVVSSSVVGKSKPEPDIFIHTAGLLLVKPEECIVIEDSANGIRAAKAANMYCVAYNGASAGNQDQSQADVQINNFSELEKIIAEHFK